MQRPSHQPPTTRQLFPDQTITPHDLQTSLPAERPLPTSPQHHQHQPQRQHQQHTRVLASRPNRCDPKQYPDHSSSSARSPAEGKNTAILPFGWAYIHLATLVVSYATPTITQEPYSARPKGPFFDEIQRCYHRITRLFNDWIEELDCLWYDDLDAPTRRAIYMKVMPQPAFACRAHSVNVWTFVMSFLVEATRTVHDEQVQHLRMAHGLVGESVSMNQLPPEVNWKSAFGIDASLEDRLLHSVGNSLRTDKSRRGQLRNQIVERGNLLYYSLNIMAALYELMSACPLASPELTIALDTVGKPAPVDKQIHVKIHSECLPSDKTCYIIFPAVVNSADSRVVFRPLCACP
eukprot:TRINITY_DN14055_c0_g1_i1.p1 TRINITY_DN14055_c0_g1~~TRINITY_DN14055_c0_g1_i1.p1  ORF type:complete len:349 (-),score=30.13 TRINITY_DN14055_c0_g1_i1:69-1115(-)